MYLCFKSQDLVVADFQLIYHTDNYVQLDFYAEGLRQEPLLYNEPIFGVRTSFGFVKGSYKDFEHNEDVFNNRIHDITWVLETTSKMIKSIYELHKINRLIEKYLKKKEIPSNLWFYYFSAITEVLKYKRFTDNCEPIWFAENQNEYEKEISKIRVSSHILLFYKKLERLKNEQNDIEIQKFIERYGFLYDFNIAPTLFEKENELKLFLSKTSSTSKKKISCHINSGDISVRLYKRMGWYEEMRHYYQARALRNYRIAFEMLGMDIFKTGIDDFHNQLKRSESNFNNNK